VDINSGTNFMKGWRNRGGCIQNPFFMKYSTFPTTGTGGSAQFGRSRFLCKAQEIISTPPDNRMACRLTAENKYCMFPSLSFSVFHEVAWVRLVRRRPLTGSGVERLSAQTVPRHNTSHMPQHLSSHLWKKGTSSNMILFVKSVISIIITCYAP